MNARRITVALFIGGLSLIAPAQAIAAPTSSTVNCSVVAAPTVRANANQINPLTRPAQVAGTTPTMRTPVTACQ